MSRLSLFAIFAFILTFPGALARADEAVLPGNGFAASRYQILWTKSPFAVASPDVVADSPDYLLVGVARNDGVSYASVVDKPTQQQHFLLSTNKPVNGLTLVSITQGHGSSASSAVIQKGGESIILKLEQPPASSAVPNMANGGVPTMPGPYPPMPVAGNMPGAPQPGMVPPQQGGVPPFPRARFHRPIINVPPSPSSSMQQQQQQQNQPPQPPPRPN